MPTGKFVKISDGGEIAVDCYNVPGHYEDSLDHILVPHGSVIDRIEKMAKDVHENTNDEELVVLCILKGAASFCKDFVSQLSVLNRCSGKSIQIKLEYIRMKSYKNCDSTGEVQILGGEDLNHITGKSVLVVEDLIDTGRTMQKLLKILQTYEPNKIEVASLMLKRRLESTGYRPDYLGFEVPDKFVVGYAIDYNEHFRDLHIFAKRHGKIYSRKV